MLGKKERKDGEKAREKEKGKLRNQHSLQRTHSRAAGKLNIGVLDVMTEGAQGKSTRQHQPAHPTVSGMTAHDNDTEALPGRATAEEKCKKECFPD